MATAALAGRSTVVHSKATRHSTDPICGTGNTIPTCVQNGTQVHVDMNVNHTQILVTPTLAIVTWISIANVGRGFFLNLTTYKATSGSIETHSWNGQILIQVAIGPAVN